MSELVLIIAKGDQTINFSFPTIAVFPIVAALENNISPSCSLAFL